MSFDYAGQSPDDVIRQAMSILGKRTSPLKAETARINGRKHKKKAKKPAVSIECATSKTK